MASTIIGGKWKEEESWKIDDLPVLVTCQFSTLVMLSSQVNGPFAHGSTQ